MSNLPQGACARQQGLDSEPFVLAAQMHAGQCTPPNNRRSPKRLFEQVKFESKKQEMAALTEGSNNPNVAETSSLRIERVKECVMATLLKCAWWKNAALARSRLAEAIEERDEQLRQKTSMSRALAKKLAACNAELGAAKQEIGSKNEQLKQEISMSRTLAKKLAVCDAELGAAKEEIAAQRSEIAAQRSKIADAKRTIFDKNDEISALTRDLEKLKDLHEVSERAPPSQQSQSRRYKIDLVVVYCVSRVNRKQGRERNKGGEETLGAMLSGKLLGDFCSICFAVNFTCWWLHFYPTTIYCRPLTNYCGCLPAHLDPALLCRHTTGF